MCAGIIISLVEIKHCTQNIEIIQHYVMECAAGIGNWETISIKLCLWILYCCCGFILVTT